MDKIPTSGRCRICDKRHAFVYYYKRKGIEATKAEIIELMIKEELLRKLLKEINKNESFLPDCRGLETIASLGSEQVK